MNIRFTGDVIEDSGLHPLISSLLISRYYVNKDYGNNSVSLFFVINCIGENTKMRKRFDSKDNALYCDIIFSYQYIRTLDETQKKAVLAEAIIDSYNILDKYKKLNIDKVKLQEDSRQYLKEIGWLREN